MPRSLPILFLFTLIGPLQAWDLHESHLRRFVGQWKGNYVVESLFGKELGHYRMEQSYYWMDGHLMGATAIELPDGSLQFEFSEVWHDGTVLRSIVESETKRMEYYGWLSNRSIWWQSHYDANTTFHQLHTEQLQPTHRGFQLRLHGYQWTAFSGQPRFLLVQAELLRLRADERFEFLQMLPE
jgi:hypothetical protein